MFENDPSFEQVRDPFENDPSFEQVGDPVLVLLPHESEPVQEKIRKSDKERETTWCREFLVRIEPVLKVYMFSQGNSGQKNKYLRECALYHHGPTLGPCYMQFMVNYKIVDATHFLQVYYSDSSGTEELVLADFLTMFRNRMERAALKQAASSAPDTRSRRRVRSPTPPLPVARPLKRVRSSSSSDSIELLEALNLLLQGVDRKGRLG